ncbi:flagellar hook assembly protein FlgD [Nocardioides houyundeii]|uniref:flagellar hook assembly protein FlgD n=1 Tax=Nocardioides houyundeii TaxID=2045452 RepID=UPI000C76E5F1|nr:flagellar hook capping FlgD N-terminal domain-containing protein [Nocardioides houyundeii]
MSIQATESVSPSLFGAPTAAPSQSATADKDMFLNLLVAQMRYQDPLNPTDSGQFLAQSAQFTALEKMQAVADQTAMLVASQMAFGATGLVGRDVTWTDATTGATSSGLVQGVTFSTEGPLLDVGGQQVPLALVATVGTTGSSTSSPTSSPTSATVPPAVPDFQ